MTATAILETIYDKEIVFFINNKIIDDFLVQEIISNATNKKIGIDMKNVTTITSKLFIDYLVQDKFRLFNIQSDVLAYLGIVLKKGFLKTYMNYQDFSIDKRQLFKRHFQVI